MQAERFKLVQEILGCLFSYIVPAGCFCAAGKNWLRKLAGTKGNVLINIQSARKVPPSTFLRINETYFIILKSLSYSLLKLQS